MRFIIVTGMSGAGKSSVLKTFEDLGYFCVDNLPVQLINKFAQMAVNSDGEYDKIAIGMDIRSGKAFGEIETLLEEMKYESISYEILFLDASDDVLVKRYKETRRTHPLAGDGRVEDGIAAERTKTAFLREKAGYVIDTSSLNVRELKKQIKDIFVDNTNFKNFVVTVVSFGFKYGTPRDVDMVFDVRFLANPYYDPKLKVMTGEDKEVRDYVLKTPSAPEFLQKLTDMVKFLIPNYINEGRNGLVIGIGCTGGKHRSVTTAIMLAKALEEVGEYGIKLEHRDINKG